MTCYKQSTSAVGGEAVNCSVICDYSYLLFDPQHLSNLVTWGLWASVTAVYLQSGQIPTTTPFDAVSLNISGIDNTGTGDGSLSIYNAPLQESLVACLHLSMQRLTLSLIIHAHSKHLQCYCSIPILTPFLRLGGAMLYGLVCFKDLRRGSWRDRGGLQRTFLCRYYVLITQSRSLPPS